MPAVSQNQCESKCVNQNQTGKELPESEIIKNHKHKHAFQRHKRKPLNVSETHHLLTQFISPDKKHEDECDRNRNAGNQHIFVERKFTGKKIAVVMNKRKVG